MRSDQATGEQPPTPSRLSAQLFASKVLLLGLKRSALELRGRPPRHLAGGAESEAEIVIARTETPLWSDDRAGERRLQQGKVQNLRRAASALDGIWIPAGALFSFWRQIGRATRRRGFVAGRMLQQGCLVPSIGGGLCQLSNALYQAALDAGCEIVERHAHSRVVPGSAAEFGRDATVAWSHVDLRFRPPVGVRLRVRLTRTDLQLEFRAKALEVSPSEVRLTPGVVRALEPRGTANSCGTCQRTTCFRHEPPTQVAAGRVAYLVDENWPEFQGHVLKERREDDLLLLPFNGRNWRLPRYAWDVADMEQIEAPLAALARTWRLRRAGAGGPSRRSAELACAAAMAETLARKLPLDVEEVCVAQSLLPHLWRAGWLGGRSVSVLMTRLPMGVLQHRLNAAAATHADRPSLSDFRAPAWLVEAEAEALAAADWLITPHAEVAALYPRKTTRLDWLPPARPQAWGAAGAGRIAFPGPTAARKGAWEVRAAARALDLEVVLLGADLEGAGFWDGVRTLRPDPAQSWLDGVDAVVQPAVVEEQPRRLLAALAAGAPVVATRACGLPEGQAGLSLIPEGDAEALIVSLGALIPVALARGLTPPQPLGGPSLRDLRQDARRAAGRAG